MGQFCRPIFYIFFSHLGQQHLPEALKLKCENRPWLFLPFRLHSMIKPSKYYLTNLCPFWLVCLLYQPSQIQSSPCCQSALTLTFSKPLIPFSVYRTKPGILLWPGSYLSSFTVSHPTLCAMSQQSWCTSLPFCFVWLWFCTCIIGSLCVE